MSEDTHDDSERQDPTRRELDRLTKLRRDVASGLLEVSEAAKRDAERLLAATADTMESDEPPPGWTGSEPARVWSSPLVYGSFALGLLCGLLLAMFLRAPQAPPEDHVVVVDQSSPEGPSSPEQPETVGPATATESERAQAVQAAESPAVSVPRAETTDRLVLTLRTHRACWLSIRVDDGEAVERLLPADETLVLEVEQEAALRVGDAAALSLFINDQPTKTLGRDGQVIELRITPSNYQTFLNGV